MRRTARIPQTMRSHRSPRRPPPPAAPLCTCIVSQVLSARAIPPKTNDLEASLSAVLQAKLEASKLAAHRVSTLRVYLGEASHVGGGLFYCPSGSSAFLKDPNTRDWAKMCVPNHR